MNIPKIENFVNSRGNTIPNQFIIRVKSHDNDQVAFDMVVFQSYNTIIAIRNFNNETTLDKEKWDYSATTSKYRNIFLNETTDETRKKIASGEYKLANLN